MQELRANPELTRLLNLPIDASQGRTIPTLSLMGTASIDSPDPMARSAARWRMALKAAETDERVIYCRKALFGK